VERGADPSVLWLLGLDAALLIACANTMLFVVLFWDTVKRRF
jgi:hypothetical protein